MRYLGGEGSKINEKLRYDIYLCLTFDPYVYNCVGVFTQHITQYKVGGVAGGRVIKYSPNQSVSASGLTQ